MLLTYKMSHKTCSRCGNNKEIELFIKNRNICINCNNSRKKELVKLKIENTLDTDEIKCSKCGIKKTANLFIKGRNICKDCNNQTRRDKYKTDEEHRLRIIEERTKYKRKKIEERKKQKLLEIGIGNKKCSFCSEIKPEERFRHNRLKCKDCERDDPKDKIKRVIRTRIYNALHSNKKMKTIEYLGCNNKEYIKWITHISSNYTLENHGKEWHIDHVIPVSKFNLNDEEEQRIAFNWKNTTAISVKENLKKNNKILMPQLQEHIEKLKIYHIENNLDLPQVYIDLFAKYLDAGTPLEPLLPLYIRNTVEELG
jgi:uncharacterized protein (DUF983 family)